MPPRIDLYPIDSDLDLAGLRQVRARPVFILGLHRSGTTFLYQVLAGSFPVAVLTSHRVVDYDRLLALHGKGATAAAERRLDELFRSWHMATRRIDEVPLSHAMPEEYGWVLRRRAGAFWVSARTAPVLDEICRKLQYLMPSAAAVLLKNPWDAGRAQEILADLPDSRFIFLRRDPVAIVNSQFRIAKLHGAETDPYLDLLLEGIPFGRAWMRLQRVLKRTLGASLYDRVALGHILRNVTSEAGRLEVSWNALPPDRRLALEYEDLVGDPDGTVERVAAFLDLPVRPEPVRPPPRVRDRSLLPEVAAVQTAFRHRLDRRWFSRS